MGAAAGRARLEELFRRLRRVGGRSFPLPGPSQAAKVPRQAGAQPADLHRAGDQSRAPKNRGYVVPSGLDIRVETRQTAIDQVRIVPHASHYTVEVIYERPVTPADVDPARIAAIDIGLNNLAAVTSNQPGLTPFLVQRPSAEGDQPMVQQTPRPVCKPNSPKASTPRANSTSWPTNERGRSPSICMSPVVASWTGWWRSASARWSLARTTAGNKRLDWASGPIRTSCLCRMRASSRCLSTRRSWSASSVIVSEESYTSKCSFLDLEPRRQA